ncbi:uncharacterized protein MELLADRAFT_108286 [Melampsora larici-populina 98AG31]|uniref:Uncharacterized protein n=1 Tax=Melampsora larici-populina (strain 98AG31 / pathotype 3-4-7) TaxID=747676 RepID=F4RSK8_MELLP|nr:uncharacterized protein MELLADRAFT_108286 [Melampsora larici-populina 98AG31]EGG04617.1 hypothetical protein MELLADRAFT_108286 [Melampsora larici-populina 98AG31]
MADIAPPLRAVLLEEHLHIFLPLAHVDAPMPRTNKQNLLEMLALFHPGLRLDPNIAQPTALQLFNLLVRPFIQRMEDFNEETNTSLRKEPLYEWTSCYSDAARGHPIMYLDPPLGIYYNCLSRTSPTILLACELLYLFVHDVKFNRICKRRQLRQSGPHLIEGFSSSNEKAPCSDAILLNFHHHPLQRAKIVLGCCSFCVANNSNLAHYHIHFAKDDIAKHVAKYKYLNKIELEAVENAIYMVQDLHENVFLKLKDSHNVISYCEMLLLSLDPVVIPHRQLYETQLKVARAEHKAIKSEMKCHTKNAADLWAILSIETKRACDYEDAVAAGLVPAPAAEESEESE